MFARFSSPTLSLGRAAVGGMSSSSLIHHPTLITLANTARLGSDLSINGSFVVPSTSTGHHNASLNNNTWSRADLVGFRGVLFQHVVARIRVRRLAAQHRVHAKKTSLMETAKRLGTVGIAFHTVTWLTTWASIHTFLSLSDSPQVLLAYLPASFDSSNSSLLMISYALTVLTGPARHGLDLAVAPFLLRRFIPSH